MYTKKNLQYRANQVVQFAPSCRTNNELAEQMGIDRSQLYRIRRAMPELNEHMKHFDKRGRTPNHGKFVYLMRWDWRSNTMYKIGISSRPGIRVKQFTKMPGACTLMGVIVCENKTEAKLLESRLHGEYSEYHDMGEWFDIPGDTLQGLIDDYEWVHMKTFKPVKYVVSTTDIQQPRFDF